jgi:hypothetical protein
MKPPLQTACHHVFNRRKNPRNDIDRSKCGTDIRRSGAPG